MSIRRLLPLLALLLLAPAVALASSNPIPGVGIIVKRNPGSSSALAIPPDFFGPGSSSFSGTVSLEGTCSHLGPTRFEECDDGDARFDFVLSSGSSALQLFMSPVTLYSSTPITVSVGGAPLVLDVVVRLSSLDPLPSSRISGQLELSPGTVLAPGSSSTLASGFLDLLATTTFVDPSSGVAVGSSLQQPLRLSLVGTDVPITRIDDGTAFGRIVLGGLSHNPAFVSNGNSGVMPAMELVVTPLSPPLPVRSSGLLCSTAGGAAIAPSSDARRLPVRNLGSSGEDGVDITLRNLHGHTMSSSSSWSSLDDGATLSYQWRCSLNGLPPGEPVIGSFLTKKGYDYWQARCDLSAFSSSSSMRCLAYSGDALVLDSPCPSSVTVDFPGTTGSSLVPAVSFELDNTARLVFASVTCPPGNVLVFGGQSVSCDRVVFVADLERDGALDVCVMRASVPASSSLHDLDFDSQSLVRDHQTVDYFDMDEDCDGFDLFATPASSSTSSRLHMSSSLHSRVLGSACDDGSCLPGGGGGGAGGLARVLSIPLRGTLFQSDAPSLALDRRESLQLGSLATEDYLEMRTRLLGSSSCSPDGVLASLELSPLGPPGSTWDSSRILSRVGGTCADQQTVTVLRRGAVVARFTTPLVCEVLVSRPPGGPGGLAVSGGGKAATKSSSNIQNNLRGPGAGLVSGGAATVHPGTPDAGSNPLYEESSLHVSVLFERTFCVDGTCVTGDDIVFTGSCSSSSCDNQSMQVTGCDLSLSRASTSSSSRFAVLGLPSSSSDVVRAVVPSSVCISSTTPVVHVPVMFDRGDATAARGASVTIQLSPNLVLASPVLEGDYFSRSGQTQLFVVDNGGGSYTLDGALLGGGCGPTDSGELFELSVARAPGAPDGVASVSVMASQAADCNGAQLPASPGGAVFILMDSGTPDAVSGLQAAQVTSGNDADGTTQVSLVWSPRSNASVELYRAPFGNHPEYDDAPNSGSVPPLPSYPPGGRWSPVALQCGGSSAGAPGTACTDEPATRDFFYYVAFARDAFGNVSPVSAMTSGTLDYHLGDVSNGVATCEGDNLVTAADISLLGSHYGATVPNGSSFACLDVGPTSTGTVSGRPLTDNRVSFSDLILFAINYSLVSSPALAARPAAAPANALSLRVPALSAPGATFDVELVLEGAGDLQGLSAQLGWDPAVVEPVRVSSGELLGRQAREGVVLSAAPGNVDAALLGLGAGLAGRGTLARVTFRVLANGDPAIRVAGLEGRDGFNREATIANASGPAGVGGRTAIRLAFPNPFEDATTISFVLAHADAAEVGVYDITGRRVRTLVSGVQAPGEHTVVWDGRDTDGRRVNAGAYVLRLEAGGHQEARSIRLVR
ncbi:MAG: hypothetical protein RL760_1478 [Candidatus Eisenbacteria bacterium]|jgi:hypothetical protein